MKDCLNCNYFLYIWIVFLRQLNETFQKQILFESSSVNKAQRIKTKYSSLISQTDLPIRRYYFKQFTVAKAYLRHQETSVLDFLQK